MADSTTVPQHIHALKIKICDCPGGIASVGKHCPENGLLQCESCNEAQGWRFLKEEKKCI